MHIALIRNKWQLSTGVASAYLPAEDLITSMFFGTLKYLPATTQAKWFAALLQGFALPADIREKVDRLRSQDVHEVMYEFWPNVAEQSRIEPDLRVEFRDRRGAFLRLLIECKWDASASGEDQLFKQWGAHERGFPKDMLHLYLVKNRDEAIRVVEESMSLAETKPWRDHWGERLLVLTWRQAFGIGTDDNDHCASWAKDMGFVARALGVPAFAGFGRLGQNVFGEQADFWQGFQGFSTCHAHIAAGNQWAFRGEARFIGVWDVRV